MEMAYVICANDSIEKVCLSKRIANRELKRSKKEMIKRHGHNTEMLQNIYVHIHDVKLIT